MKKNPKDHELARKIGQAYVKAHLYTKVRPANCELGQRIERLMKGDNSQAVNYYEAALKSGHQHFLRLDLAELLFQLKNVDKCERVLRAGLDGVSKSPQGFPPPPGRGAGCTLLLQTRARWPRRSASWSC